MGLSPENSVLICIDYQEKLLPKIHLAKEIIKKAVLMVKSAKVLKVPVVVTEQYPKGLGRTVAELREALGDHEPIEKIHFNCFGSERFARELEKLGRENLLTMGIEAHVCVYQTVVEALDRGYQVYLLEDAVSSRSPEDRRIAFERMVQAGAKPSSVEMAIYEMLKAAGTPEFKEILKFVK